MENSRFELIRYYDTMLPDLMVTPGFYEYAIEVYNYLEIMKPGTILNLQATGDKFRWLLVTTGAFLAAQDHWMDFELNDDYTRLRRKFLSENFRKAMRQS